jgi:hypothetical protein
MYDQGDIKRLWVDNKLNSTKKLFFELYVYIYIYILNIIFFEKKIHKTHDRVRKIAIGD